MREIIASLRGKTGKKPRNCGVMEIGDEKIVGKKIKTSGNIDFYQYDIPKDKMKDGKVCVTYMVDNKEVTQVIDFSLRRETYTKTNSVLDFL